VIDLLQDRRTRISKLRNPYPHRFITLSLLLRISTQPLLIDAQSRQSLH